MTILLFVIGAFLLVGGAELLVRGASKLAAAAGISPLVIGLTVVAFGTSTPELAVTAGAAMSGSADVAIGNVVGSNIANVLLILGLSAMVAPLTVAQQLVRIDVPLMIGISVGVLLLSLDGGISRLDGLLLVAGLISYTWFAIAQSRKETSAIRAEYSEAFGEGTVREPWFLDVLFILLGLAMLVVGAGWLVDGAVAAAEALGVSELVIGLTIVAVGTSLPELATSVLASFRGERDIAVGNVVGSNIFNLLAVLGIGGVIAPAGIAVSAAVRQFDMPVMIAVAIACLPVFFSGYRIARWEGCVFVGYYVAYATYLVMDATRHVALGAFEEAMLFFAIPLTVITLAVFTWRHMRKPPA